MIELGQILAGLVQRTAEGKLKWRRTVQDDRFVTSVDAISIVIVELHGYFDADLNLAPTTHRLDIYDESGEIVESFGDQDTNEEEDKQLARLYVLARRSALNIDSTLEKIAKALDL